MFNFAGKSTQCVTKAPIEIDFTSFWKTLDESYFARPTPDSLENKWQEIISKTITFTQNHHRGIMNDSS